MRKTATLILIILTIAFISGNFIACKRLSPSFLRGNYHLKAANAHYADEKYLKASYEYEEALQYNPSLKVVPKYLGSCYTLIYKPGDKSPKNLEIGQKAVDNLNRALEAEPNNRDIILALGDIYDKMEKFEEAEKFYQKVLQQNPNDVNAYNVIAEFYTKNKKDEKAIDMYEKRIALNPDDPAGYVYLAKYYFDKAKYDDAIKNYELRGEKIAKISDEAKKNEMLAENYYRIGHVLWNKTYQTPEDGMSPQERTGIIGKGLDAFQKATELNPTYPEPWAYMGLMWLEKKKVDPKKEAEYQAQRDKFIERFTELRKRQLAAEDYKRQLDKMGK
jgi:tetratricopeptide (TPR) repeat protein